MSGIKARETVEAALRRELFGPLDGDPVRGQPLTIRAVSSGRIRSRLRIWAFGTFSTHERPSGSVEHGTRPHTSRCGRPRAARVEECR